MRRGLLLYNPAAGRRRAAALRDRLARALVAAGWDLEVASTGGPGAVTAVAREQAAAGRIEAIFALGGDGTQREVAAGLLGSDVALGVLPAGTTNVLARALGIPLRPVAAARALAGGRRRPLSVGLAGDTPFLMMVSAGLDAAIMAALSVDAKARWGKGAVVAQGLLSWWAYDFPGLAVRWGGGEASGTFAALCNIPLYAGPFRMAPAARLDDDHLELVLLRPGGRLAILGFCGDLVRGRHLERRDVLTARVEEVELGGPTGLPLQVDGDPCPLDLPVRVRVASPRLQVLIP